jgi:hypothetical protein
MHVQQQYKNGHSWKMTKIHKGILSSLDKWHIKMWCDLCVCCEAECQCLGIVLHTNWSLFCGVKRLFHKIILGEIVPKACHQVSR